MAALWFTNYLFTDFLHIHSLTDSMFAVPFSLWNKQINYNLASYF